MKKLLSDISVLSIQLEECEFATNFQKENNWLGFEAANEKEIIAAEEKLNIKLPKDYKDFLRITNGFTAPNTIEPSFMKIQDVEYLNSIDPFLIEVWSQHNALDNITYLLKRSILVGGVDEEQYFLLIPPSEKNENWLYWTFSTWAPGESEHTDIETYFKNVLNFMEENK